jgi:hypothetical protein
VELYAASYLAILVFQKVFHYFLPAPLKSVLNRDGHW